MIAAIHEMVDKKDELTAGGKSDLMTVEFLQACHFIFERGILSHEIISSSSSPCLANISEGMKWFFKWKELESVQEDPGTCTCRSYHNYMHEN